ncbi:MAG: alpha/beta hydrolase [Planctomycetota bacterium]|jgi:hypothetical protein
MKRILSVLGVLVLASAAASPAGDADPLAGQWSGFHVDGGTFWHEITVKKRGKAHFATDLTYCLVGLADAKGLAGLRGGRRPSTDALRSAIVVFQQYRVTTRVDEVVFASAGMKKIKGGGYNADNFTCTLDPEGYLYGTTLDAAGSEGLVWLRRVDPPTKKKPFDLPRDGRQRVTCWTHPDYHFTVSLPKSFDPAVPTPMLVYHSPGGNAGPFMPDVANELGWVSVGLTESKNGPVGPGSRDRAATLFHLASRMEVHPRRVYFAGLSGGSRVSHDTARQFHDMCAGVIGIAAGLGGNDGYALEPEFLIAGNTDYNKGEVCGLYRRLMLQGIETELIIHPGGHSLGRHEDHARAMRWMDREWFSGTEPLEPTDDARFREVAGMLLAKARDEAAPDRRECCYWLARMAANRKKELPKEISDAIKGLAKDPVYKEESQAFAMYAAAKKRRLNSSVLKAIRTRFPESTLAKRVAAMD